MCALVEHLHREGLHHPVGLVHVPIRNHLLQFVRMDLLIFEHEIHGALHIQPSGNEWRASLRQLVG